MFLIKTINGTEIKILNSEQTIPDVEVSSIHLDSHEFKYWKDVFPNLFFTEKPTSIIEKDRAIFKKAYANCILSFMRSHQLIEKYKSRKTYSVSI